MKIVKFFLSVSILLYSSLSYAEWTWISNSTNGSNFYIDFETIRINNDYRYILKFALIKVITL